MINIAIWGLILVLIFLLYRLKAFVGNRITYLVILSFISTVIAGRLACKSLKCIKYLPEYINEKYYGAINLLPKNCDECKPDWNIREGIDESALILFGIFVFFVVLFIKNIRISELIDRISKITLPGLEVDLLEKKLNEYEKSNFQQVENEIAEDYVKTQQDIITKSSNNEERLLLLNVKIEEILREIYTKSIGFQNEYIPASTKEIISQLEKNKIIDTELSNLLIDFNNVRIINATKSNGKKTLGLIEIGGRILRILLSLIKRFFKASRIFYGETEGLTIDRLKVESVSEEEIIVCATINTIDSNKNYFPIETLKSDNFIITETLEGIENIANIKNIIAFGASHTNLNIILLIDCSTSMGGGSKLEKSKDAAIQLLNELSKFKTLNCQVVIYKITDKNGGYIDNMWFNINDSTLPNKIRELQADGWTPLWNSIDNAMDLACDPKVIGYKMIVCLTDGLNDEQGQSKDLQNAKFIKLKNRVLASDIHIVSIGLGMEDYKEMIELSTLSGAGGKNKGYFIGISAKDLKGIFDDIIFSITKSYRIFWKPTFNNKNRIIDVDLDTSFITQKGDIKKDKFKFKYKI